MRLSESESGIRAVSSLDRFPLGPPGEGSVALRAAGLWMLVRIVAAVFTSGAGGSVVALSAMTSIMIVAMAGFLAAMDARNHNEHLFIANLGTSRVAFGALCVVPPLVGEILLAVVLR